MRALVLGWIVMAAMTAAAVAQPKQVEAETAYKYGQSLYMKEDYEGAAKQFKAAYDLDPDPVYLFNIAQAMRLAKHCRGASEYYQRYLREAKKAPNEETVKTYIVEMDECAKQEPVVAPPPTETPVTDPAEVVAPPPTTDDGTPRSTKRLAGYIVGGTGVGLVGLGFYFMARVSALEDDANNVCPDSCTAWDPMKTARRAEIDDKAHLREKLMVGSWIAGGAAIAAGIYLVVTGGAKTESSVAITPTRNGAMVSLSF